MQPKRLMYGLARVRIAGTDLQGEEVLFSPPYYERHIFIKEYGEQGSLKWLTARHFLGRSKIFPRPEDLPIRYRFLANFTDQFGASYTAPTEAGLNVPTYTGMFVGEPINAYVPIPLVFYVASPMDQFPVSKYNLYPNIYPYAVATYNSDTTTPGYFKVVTQPLQLAVHGPLPVLPFEEIGLTIRGSIGIIYTLATIPKAVVLKSLRVSTRQESSYTFQFPKVMIDWKTVVEEGQQAVDRLKSVLFSFPTERDLVLEGPKPQTFRDSEEGVVSELVDGYVVGVYLDWVSGGKGNVRNDFGDFTFGFYLAPMAPIFQQTAAIAKTSMIRVFWGGYYMIEILPNATNFYFFKDGYSVPSDPSIPTEHFSLSKNPLYKNAVKHGGAYQHVFNLKYLRPIVNGNPFPPNVFINPINNMSFPWGAKAFQAGGEYDLYIIMHLRNHVCIFSYNAILKAAVRGEKVEPLFAFNPLEYIARYFGAEEAKRWWRNNGYTIARPDCPPKMWFFNVSCNVVIPYIEYAETAIATKPTFIIPSTLTLIGDPSLFHFIKVAPSGIFVKGTSGARGLNVPEIPIVLSEGEPFPAELNTYSAMIYGPEVSPTYLSVPHDKIILTRGIYRNYGKIAPLPERIGMRIFAVPSLSPDYPFIVEHVGVEDPVMKYLVGEVSGKTPFGALTRDDILMTTVTFRTRVVDAYGQEYWGEISGYYPTLEERAAGAPLSPTFDGEKGPFIDYLDEGIQMEIVLKGSPLLPRPPVFIGADIFRTPVVAASKLAPPSIRFIFPAPRYSQLDTNVESVSVTLTDTLEGSTATVKAVVDESLFERYLGIQPIETVATGLSIDPLNIGWEIPYPSKLLYRRMLIELGYVLEMPDGSIEGYLYPVFDGIITGVSISGTRETSTGRQIEVTLKGADIFTRLRWVPATGKDPILDNWTPGAFAMWAVAAAGLSPLRVKGITGLPMGAPLTWWLGNERIAAADLLGGYGFPLQNVPEHPRAEIGAGGSLGDALERFAGISGCEVISLPSPSVIYPLLQYKSSLDFVWRYYLLPSEYNQFVTPVSEYISPAIFGEIGGYGNYWWSVPWRSTLAIIPAGYYSPIPSWTLVIGPQDYTQYIIPASIDELIYQVTVPEAPFAHGLIELQAEEGIWNLPTQVTVEGLTIFGVPFYYIWADINREVNPFAWYYGGFRIPKYVLNPNIVTTAQAKLAALRAYFSGRLFPPKTLKASLSVGLPFLYPRQTVRLVTSSNLAVIPPVGRSVWVIRAVTHTWEAGDTPKTVLDLCVPHWFPIGIPTQ
jgi:hypothetical protein